MKRNISHKYFLSLLMVFFAFVNSNGQIKRAFTPRFNDTFKGNITQIANNIVNRGPASNANTPYNTFGNSNSNDLFNMQFIDIDNDPSTYNSSSANLFVEDPTCSRIVYAGLYWSATYKYDTGTDASTGRSEDWNTIKFKIPGGNYQNITATDVLYNGFPESGTDLAVAHSPYSCYADVTTLLQGLTNPNGTYTAANIRVSKDGRVTLGNDAQGNPILNPFAIRGGVSGGWSLVVIYRNVTLTGKRFTTYDGYGVISSATQGQPQTVLDIPVSGFVTIPNGPVVSKLGVVALEGDNAIRGDNFQIKANSSATFRNLTYAPTLGLAPTLPNGPFNYFNSTITLNGLSNVNRNPASLNTLGWDSHLNLIANPLNTIIPNNETGAVLRASTSADKFDIFYVSFDVEVIEPEISVIKTATNLAGADISGQTITLGQTFFYDLTFYNSGNDAAVNFVITDDLPDNIIFPPNGVSIQPGDLILPFGITYTYNPATQAFVFNIPNSLVGAFGNEHTIRIKVRTPESCEDVVIDACSNVVTNQAYFSYNGVLNPAPVTDNPSYNGYDVCLVPTPGATNYLLNIENCNFTSQEVICGPNLVLTAPSGYLGYQWTNSSGVVIGNSQTVTVTSSGVYTVSLTIPNPCASLELVVTVVDFVALVTTNPVIPFADQVVVCPNNGEQLPKIFLCGTTDSQLIETGNTSSSSIVWEQLVENSCPVQPLSNLCPNTNPSCTWNQVGTGPDYLAATPGQYRVIFTFQNGCFKIFYFNVYKNVLNPTIVVTNKICNTPGTITINNVPAGYQFSLSPTGPFQNSNFFPISTAGVYTVYIQQTGVIGGCLFSFPQVSVLEKIPTFNIIKTDKLCNTSFGSIRIQINDVEPQYSFQINQGATVVGTFGPTTINDYTFNNLNPGTYTVTASTDDGCLYTENVTILNLSNLNLVATVSQHISCSQGNIQMNPSGGQTPYNYAIYSYNGVVVPPSNYQFQNSVIFDIEIGQQGVYQFIVVDSNNCTALSNLVTINLEPPVITSETHTNVTCNGLNNGTITITAAPTNGYNLTYSINGVNFQSSNVFNNLAPGNYVVTIKYQKGNNICTFTINVTITEPPVLIGQPQLVQNLTCTTTGTIQAINVSGGTSPYQYSINGVTFQNSPVFSNLTAGTYIITIKDFRNCIITTSPITFTTPTPLTDLTFSSTSLSCPAVNSNLTATIVGGTSPYVFQIITPSVINPTSSSGNNAVFNTLEVGTYTIKVTDNKGCTYQENYTINPISFIDVAGSVTTNVNCFGANNGVITLNVSGFITNYSYVVNSLPLVNNQTTGTITLSNLAVGNYTITVRDLVTNCQDTITLTVAGPSSLLTLNAVVTPKTCINNGIITATAAGGWGSYQYSITLPSGTIVGPQNSGVFGNLTQTGVYTVTVRDANGCIITTNATINPTSNPDIIINPLSNFCITSTSGATIVVSTTGGVPAYQYQINGGTLQNSNTFSNLGAGSYVIKVIDAYSCEDTVSIVIPPQLTAQAVLTKDLDCTASPNAIINVTINGGLIPYQYQIKFNGGAWGVLTPVTSSTFSYTTSIAGTYQFQITEAQGCIFQTNIITINPLSNPSIVSVTPVTPSCNGFNNGTLTVNINPALGTAPLQYNLNGGIYQNSNIFAGLIAGTYTIGVKDFKNCIDTETVVLSQPLPLLGQSQLVQPITCVITTGTIQAISVSGGTAPYQYSVNGITFGNNPIFSGLNAGTYTITIKDDKGCVLTTTPITLVIPQSISDITLTTSPITCPSLSTTIQATAVGGTAPYIYQIIAPSTINPTSTSGNTAGFNNLSVATTATFIVKVTDANGCVYQKNITIPTISLIAVSGIVNNSIACLNDTNGQITFNVSGFTTNYSYTINSGTIVTNQTSPTIVRPNLAAGNYSIVVTDLITNCTATTSVTVQAPSAQLTLLAPITQPTCSTTGSVNAAASGGWGTYEYTLTYPSGTQVNQNTGLYTNLVQNGNYIIKVRDLNGCEVSQTFTLVPYINPSLTINTSASDLCYDTVNGATITVTTTGGTANFQYQIQLNGGAYSSLQNSPIFINLLPGNYTIRAVDNFGCTATVSQVILPQLIAQVELTKNLDCSTGPNAIINLNVTGGASPYQYQVNINSAGFSAFTNITTNPFNYSASIAGTYQFIVRDVNGCTFTSNVITINPITFPIITSLVQTTSILCNGNNNATITTTINTSVGVGPFTYSINGINFQTSPTFTGLAAGIYTVTVKDSNQCIDTETITINQPNAVNYTVTKSDIICTGAGTSYGEINVTGVTGGIQPYTYYLSNNFGLIDQYASVTNENHTFVVLNFGIYSVEVIDANGCSLIRNNIVIASPPDDLIIDVSTATANCTSGGTAIITVSSPVGSGSYVFAILTQNTPPPYPGPSWVVSNPGTPDTATFNGLIPGVTYTFIVLDLITNCYYFETANAPIISPSTIVTTINLVQNVSCTGSGNGSVSFTLSNFDPSTTSISYQVFNAQSNTPTVPPYTGTVTIDQPTETINNFASLPPGIYYLLITENDGVNVGCTTASANFQITQSTNLLTVVATASNDNCNTNAGIVSAIGQYGTPGYTFIIQNNILPAPIASNTSWGTASAFNVESGNYIVYIKDANGCIQQTPVTVGLDTTPEIVSVTVTNPCANNGSFIINVTRNTTTNIGIPPYTYQLDGGVSFVQNAPSFTISNLSSGNHVIRIIDNNGCFFDFPFTINQNLSGNVIVVDQPTCVPPNSGLVQATAINGTGTYTFTINTPTPVINSSGTFSNLPFGNYIITINDGVCSIPLTISLDEPNPVDFTIIKQDPKCDGDANGIIEVILNPLNDNNPPYTYTLSAPGFTTITQISNPIFNNLSENNYTVTVESIRNCELTLPISLNDPNPIVANNLNLFSFSCTPGNVAGTITLTGLTVTGGNSNYLYSIDDINFQNSSVFTVVDTGVQQTIRIYIKDTNGCKTTFDYVIDPLITISNPSVVVNTPLSCNSSEQITISFLSSIVSPGNYTYQLLPSGTITPFTGNSFTPSALTNTGQYTYQIVDITTGCTILATHTVVPYPVTNVIAQPAQVVNCFGISTGQLSFTLQNYSGSYSYNVFTSPLNTSIVTGTSSLATFTTTATLAAGNYYVVINENAYPFCTITSPVITITSPTQALAVQLQQTNDRDCGTTNTGTILATATGGTTQYLYQLSNAGGIIQAFSSDNYFENLQNGSYTVSVTDANNCPTSNTITVGLDPLPLISISLVNPCAAEGQYEINVTRDQDGISPYSYILDSNAPVVQNASSFTISNLLSGLHTITLTDVNGCSNTRTITIIPNTIQSVQINNQPSCLNNDGAIQVTATSGSGFYSFSINTTIPVTNTTGTFTGLAAGNYIVSITDTTTGCTKTVSFTLETPTPVTFTQVATNPSCNGLANGSISVTLGASNNNPPYTYNLNNGTATISQNNGLFTNLPSGTYTVTVVSNRDCEASEIITITNPPVLNVTATATPFNCNPNNTINVATITATASGGTLPYLYSIDGINFQNSNTFSIVNNGLIQNIVVSVKDFKNCINTFLIPINPLPQISATTVVQSTALTCTNSETVLISVVGGSGNYTYQLLPTGAIQGPTGNSFSFDLGNDSGSFVFLITDVTTGCSVQTLPYVIAPLNQIIVTASNPTNVNCFGDTNGNFQINVTGYVGNYNYTVIDNNNGATVSSGSNSTTNNPVTINNVIAGNYTVSIVATNSPFCSTISNLTTIGSPNLPLTLTIQQTAAVTCTNNQGTITATADGGNIGSYQYQLTNSTTGAILVLFGNSSVFNSLPAGNYTVTVRDVNNCVASQSIILLPPAPINATFVVTNPILSCFNDTNASVTITANGGEGIYQYTLNYSDGTTSGPQIGNVFNNLGAGTYTVTVTDGWDCIFTTLPFTISQPLPIAATLSLQSPLTCNNNAVIVVNASGGSGTYSYSIDGTTFGSNNTFSVGPGTYQYYVTDSNNCTAVLTNTIVINPIPALQLELDTSNTSINCFGDANASIGAIASGGLGNYQYSLLNASLVVIDGPQSIGLFTGLTPGTYSIQVTSGDCTFTSNTVTVSEPPELLIANLQITNISCNGLNDGNIEVTATGGTGVYQYAITDQLNQFFDIETFTNLSAGLYTIIVQDSNGCFKIVTAQITEPTELIATAFIQPELCEGEDDGTVTLTISGGTSPYFTSFNDDSPGAVYVQGQTVFNNLSGGQDYFIYIKDQNGCTTNVFVPMATPVTMTPTFSIDYDCTSATIGSNNTVTITVEAGIQSQVQYSLDNNSSYQASNVFSDLTNGNHTIYVKHTNGCEKMIPITITNYQPIQATITTINIICFGGNTGDITISNVIGGSGNYQYAISPAFVYSTNPSFNNLTVGDYIIKIKDSEGCVKEYTIRITQGNDIIITTAQIDQEICEGDEDAHIEITVSGGVGPYSTSLNNQTNYIAGQFNFFNLSGGQTYTIWVKDSAGCEKALIVTLNPAVNMNPIALVNYGCLNNVNVNGVTINVDPIYQGQVLYSINGVDFSQNNVFSNLAAENYTGYVLHTNGCLKTTDVLTINQVIPLNLTAQETGLNQITALATNGVAPYSYIFNGIEYGAVNVFLFETTGIQTITAIDSIGCERTIQFPATFYDIEIPNYFTPGSDGINDGWTPLNIDNFPNIITKIFDRYGREVKILRRGETWDGTYENKPLPSGDYWYLVEINNGSGRTFVGNFTLYR